MSEKVIKILLVEDNRGDALLLENFLTDADSNKFDILNVRKLSEAFDRLKDNCFDIILLDLSLPDSQGFETFEQMKDRGRDVPIVILSGLNDEEMAVLAVRGGAQDYLVKGQFGGELLPRTIRYAIERHQLLMS